MLHSRRGGRGSRVVCVMKLLCWCCRVSATFWKGWTRSTSSLASSSPWRWWASLQRRSGSTDPHFPPASTYTHVFSASQCYTQSSMLLPHATYTKLFNPTQCYTQSSWLQPHATHAIFFLLPNATHVKLFAPTHATHTKLFYCMHLVLCTPSFYFFCT